VSGVEYCNVCENFPCLGGHPPGIDEALTAMEAAFIRHAPMSRAELGDCRDRYAFSVPPGCGPGAPLLSLFRGPSIAERRAAEEQDRREWLEAVTRRLRLVAEVHRCRVWKRGEGDWARRCLRPGCPAGQPLGWAPSQQYALGDALAHAGAFLPLPPEEEPGTGLDWDGYVPLLDGVRWSRGW
jgi:hypothetical protein